LLPLRKPGGGNGAQLPLLELTAEPPQNDKRGADCVHVRCGINRCPTQHQNAPGARRCRSVGWLPLRNPEGTFAYRQRYTLANESSHCRWHYRVSVHVHAAEARVRGPVATAQRKSSRRWMGGDSRQPELSLTRGVGRATSGHAIQTARRWLAVIPVICWYAASATAAVVRHNTFGATACR
jgi:hypothetical protein